MTQGSQTFPSGASGFNYPTPRDIKDAGSLEEAVRITVMNYMFEQCGWTRERCEERVAMEMNRTIAKSVFDELEALGWKPAGARLLDVGAGQGGTVLEAFERGAEAYGVEPGREFCALAKRRLEAAGGDPERVVLAPGESLPFPADWFDYLISLQVLEHVPDPSPLLREMFRVLKPGGECFISCENYLSFREQHYRVAWLPMLPKRLGAVYLRAIGRNPAFLQEYVYYTTYPQIWRLARQAGFQNVTHEPVLSRLADPSKFRRAPVRLLARLASPLGVGFRRRVVSALLHAKDFWRVGVRIRLVKPK